MSLVTAPGCSAPGSESKSAAITREIPWVNKGVWLRADTHVHTSFSDGAHSVEEVVSRAEQNGLDVIAITDHLDRNLKGATPAYFAAINTARERHPGMIILAGAEWNLPPWGGDEHAVILVPRRAEPSLEEFKANFDDLDRTSHDGNLALAGLRWLRVHASDGEDLPLVVYEHPSRRSDRSLARADVMRQWLSVNDVVIGFAGAPGHQGKAPFGAYKNKEVPLDRWDPVAARGDAWDVLLKEGHDVWAAYAPSDFHNADPADLGDFWPGQFSSTWLYVPERTEKGVLQALRAGSFFAEHGQLIQRLQIGVTTDGQSREAGAGEVVRVPAGAPLSVSVRFDPAAPAREIESIEIIGVTQEGARVLRSGHPSDGSLTHSESTPRGGLVVRARGYHRSSDGSRLAFYSNPVRVVTD